jgi:hypothetical protein
MRIWSYDDAGSHVSERVDGRPSHSILSALMLYQHPMDHSKWELMILIFSILSIFGSAMARYGAGLILGVLGGVFALA